MSEQSHEFSAKSVEAAIEDGLRQLGVGRDKVDIEVLHEGSRGLLGIGSTNARVRMTIRTAPAPSAPSTPAPAPAKPAPPVAEATKAVAISDSGVADAEEDGEPAVAVAEMDEGWDDESEDEDSAYGDSGEEQDDVVALSSKILLEMVSLMGLDARVEGSLRKEEDEDDVAIYLNLIGDDLGVLIGRHGETLSSMQYLVRLMVNQKLHRWTNIVVDVDGYKDRRAEKLAQMALRMADQVVETGRSVALEPMPANERRLIHIALRNHPQVHTESIGEDTRRKIQILLK